MYRGTKKRKKGDVLRRLQSNQVHSERMGQKGVLTGRAEKIVVVKYTAEKAAGRSGPDKCT